MTNSIIDVDKIINKALSLGVNEVEVYIASGKRLSIDAIKDRIEYVNYVHKVGLGLRVVIGKKVACYGASITKPEEANKVIERAIKIAKASSEDKYWISLPKRLGKSVVEGVYDSRVESISSEEAISIVKNCIDTVKNYDKRVSPVEMSLTIATGEFTIGNCYSETVSRKDSRVIFAIEVKARENGREGVYHDSSYSKRLDVESYNDVALKSAIKALENVKAKPIETVKTSVIFEGKVFASIVASALVPAVTADNVQQNRSPLKGKLGQQILSETLTLIDDPYYPWLFESKEFDDEGVATKRNIIVRSGVLETYVYDTYTALREGRESTGNAYKPGLSSAPRPWIHNLIIDGGSGVKLEDMIKDTKHGILVSSTIGYWLSNPVSGYVTATITHGYLIRDGSIVDYVKGVVISDNIYDMLKGRIELFGTPKEREYYLNVYTPPVKIRDVTIAGK